MQEDWGKFKDLYLGCLARDDIPNAILFLEKAIELAIVSKPQEVASMCNSLANLYLRSDNLIAAEKAARKSIAWELEFGPRPRGPMSMANYYIMLSRILEKQLRFVEALANAEKGIALFAEHFREDDLVFQNLLRYRELLTQNTWRG